MLDNGQTVLRADQIAKMTDSLGAAPKVAKFPVAGERGGVPDDVIVNVLFVDVRADDIGMITLEKTLCKFAAEAIGFLRRDLAGLERLPHMIRNHVVFLFSAGAGLIAPLGKAKLRVCDFGVTLKAGNEPALIGLFCIFDIFQNVADRRADAPPLSDVQRHDAGRCHAIPPFGKNVRAPEHVRRSFADLMVNTVLNESPQRLQQCKQPCSKHWDTERTDEERNYQQNNSVLYGIRHQHGNAKNADKRRCKTKHPRCAIEDAAAEPDKYSQHRNNGSKEQLQKKSHKRTSLYVLSSSYLRTEKSARMRTLNPV